MKKWIILFLLIPFICPAQKLKNITEEVPVQEGKVIYSIDIPTLLTREQTKNKLQNWLPASFLNDKSVIASEQDDYMVVRCTDYLLMEKTNWMLFAMYMRYTLLLEYKDNFCKVTIRGINFIEPEQIEAASKNSNNNTDIFSAEYIMIEKNYKVLTIKEASEKITRKAQERIDEVFEDMKVALQQM